MAKITVHDGASNAVTGEGMPEPVESNEPSSFSHSGGESFQPEPADAETQNEYDPADHNVTEVNEKLRELDKAAAEDEGAADEFDRILRAEREGKNRAGIVGAWELRDGQ